MWTRQKDLRRKKVLIKIVQFLSDRSSAVSIIDVDIHKWIEVADIQGDQYPEQYWSG